MSASAHARIRIVLSVPEPTEEQIQSIEEIINSYSYHDHTVFVASQVVDHTFQAQVSAFFDPAALLNELQELEVVTSVIWIDLDDSRPGHYDCLKADGTQEDQARELFLSFIEEVRENLQTSVSKYVIEGEQA